jgi:hypothetical protein
MMQLFHNTQQQSTTIELNKSCRAIDLANRGRPSCAHSGLLNRQQKMQYTQSNNSFCKNPIQNATCASNPQNRNQCQPPTETSKV